MSLSLSSAYQGSTHTSPDTSVTSQLIWLVADTSRDKEIQVFKEDRVRNSKVRATLDILSTGDVIKLKLSLLGSFNRRICAMVNGHIFKEEEDTIPQLQFSLQPKLEEIVMDTGVLWGVFGWSAPVPTEILSRDHRCRIPACNPWIYLINNI
jgi:hypothetical protein